MIQHRLSPSDPPGDQERIRPIRSLPYSNRLQSDDTPES